MNLAYIHRLRSCSSTGGESSGAEILKSAAEKLSRLYWDNRNALDELVQAAVLEKFESELEAHRARAEYRTREDQYFKATGGQKDGAVKQVLIRTLLKGTITLLLKPSDSIAFVKLILQQKNEGVCLDQMRLILGGKQLEDERTLSEYDFEEESTIDLVLRLRGGMADFTTGAPDVLQGGGSQSTTRTVVSPTRQPSARIAGRVERARAAAPVAGVVAAQPQPRPRPDDFVAPTKEAIATMHVRLQELLEAMSERSSTGKQRSGRYLQADSARRHYIMHIGFRQLQVGVLPTATDLRMLFGPAPIKGTKEQPAMEKWIKERSGWREGHSNVTIGSTEEQTTMLQFYSTREDMVSDVATHRAPVGRPAKYKFDFGVFKGETLDRLIKPSVSVTGVGGAVTRGIDYVCGFIMGKEFVWRFPEHLKLYLELVSFEDRPLTSPTFKMIKPMGAGALSAFGSFMGQAFPGLAAVAASDDAAVDNGAPVAKNFYVFWSRAQSMNKHGAVYIESRILLALETTLIQVARIFGDDDGSLTIVIRDGKGVTQTVKLDATEPAYAACVNRRTHFDFSNANARVSFQSTRFSPALLAEIPLLESGSTSNTDFVEPAPLGTSSTNAGALQADTTLQEESITNVDFLNDARQRELADKAGDFLSSDQQGQYDSILAMFENGTLGKLSTLNSTTLKPRKLDSNSDEADYNLRDVTFWDPEEQFAGVVDATPCANKGWAHARHVKRHGWAKRPRRVTGKERDAFVAGRATTCSECKDVAKRLNSLIAALKSIGPLDLAQTKRLAELREERATCRYNQSTLSTNVINYFSERFPGQAATFPFVLTHRAAVTKGLAREITRSARTPQQPHDLESEISELRALAKEDRAIYYHANRLFQKRRGAACVLPLEYKEPEDMKVISDTWLADFIDAYAHSKDQYIRQWHEQMVLVDVAQMDHSCKLFYRQRVESHIVLRNQLTLMNSMGQIKFAVNTETTSFNDPRCMAAFDMYRQSCKTHCQELAEVAVCDNPRRDAKGISENIWNGAGRELMAFGGDIVVVTSEEQCDSEVGELEASGASVAIDTENVAFIDGSGANIAAAAIAQIFQSGQSSLVKKTLIFSLHEWPSLFASFARFLESNIEKIGVTVAHDVSALKKRFPEVIINATVDVATIVKSAGYTGSMSLQGMAHAVLGAHVDKRIDHTGWQGPLGERQLRYAATDVYVTMSIYQRACAIVSGTASLSPVVGCRGDDDITEESPKTPTECSRNGAGSYSRGAGGAGGAEAHTISRPGALEILEVIDEVNGPEDDSDDTDEAAAAAANDDERPAANDDADDTGAAHVEGGATLRNISMTAAKQMIKDYAATLTRNTPLQLLQEFSSSERKMLHDYCDNFNLVHQSAGNGRDRHLVISRWKPLAPLLAHEGACAVQALVAKESTVPEASAAGFVRGYVRSFDAAVVKWIARYSDGTESVLELEELNAQLERRYRADHGAGLGPLAPAPLIGGESVEVLYQKLVKGIDPNWRNTDVKYDIRHWLANLSTIGAGDKKGSQFKILVTSLSMALFEILLGEYARWVRHALQLGMSPRLVKLLKRKYLRRRARYAIPEPKILLRRLLDTVVVFSLMEDSLQPGSKFFTADWLKVFLHEMTYVQQGRISDKPLMIMYVQVGVYPSTGMEIWRNRRTTSPLEGYHCHTKLSTSQLARASGPRSKHVRGSLFNFAWTIKAGIMAGLMFNLKHFEPWLVDILYDMYKNENEKPAHLKSWVRLDTEKTPCLVMGVAGPEGINAGKYIPPSMQKSSEWMAAKLGHALPSPLLTEHDIKKVLAHPDMVARGDVGGILRATGLFSSARSLQDLVTRIMLRTKTDAILNSAGASRLLARLRTTAPVLTPVGGVLAAPRAQADVSVGPLPLVGDPRVPCALFSPQSEPPLPSPAPLPAHAPPALPRSPLTAPDGDRTLTLAKLPGLKRKRLRWFSVRLHVSHKDDKDEDRRKNLKRKLEEIGGSWTPPAGLTVPANVSV